MKSTLLIILLLLLVIEFSNNEQIMNMSAGMKKPEAAWHWHRANDHRLEADATFASGFKVLPHWCRSGESPVPFC